MSLRAIMRRLFETVISYYVDGTHVTDVEPGSGGAVEALQEVMSLPGRALDNKKRQPPSCCVQSLGCELPVQNDCVCWALDGAKRETWLGDIRRHLASGVMQLDEAAKLYGRVAFGGRRVFGRRRPRRCTPIGSPAARQCHKHCGSIVLGIGVVGGVLVAVPSAAFGVGAAPCGGSRHGVVHRCRAEGTRGSGFD